MSTLPDVLWNDVERRLRKYRLSELASEIRDYSSTCISFAPTEANDHKLGVTKFGGTPDLPRQSKHPVSRINGSTKYLNFLCQINFRELAHFELDVLPRTGICYFFVKSISNILQPVEVSVVFHRAEHEELKAFEYPDDTSFCCPDLVDLSPVAVSSELSVSIDISSLKRNNVFIESAGDLSERLQAVHFLNSKLKPCNTIAQILGHATNSDDIELQRRVALTTLNRRGLMLNDHWSSVAELQASIDQEDDSNTRDYYERMRPGVEWLDEHADSIDEIARTFRMLLRINSNSYMNFNVFDSRSVFVFERKTRRILDNKELFGELF